MNTMIIAGMMRTEQIIPMIISAFVIFVPSLISRFSNPTSNCATAVSQATLKKTRPIYGAALLAWRVEKSWIRGSAMYKATEGKTSSSNPRRISTFLEGVISCSEEEGVEGVGGEDQPHVVIVRGVE